MSGRPAAEGGNTAGMDLPQASPDVDVVFAINDYMPMGAAPAAKSLGKGDLMLLGSVVDAGDVLPVLQDAGSLYTKPSKAY